jgi:hypothetical protein
MLNFDAVTIEEVICLAKKLRKQGKSRESIISERCGSCQSLAAIAAFLGSEENDSRAYDSAKDALTKYLLDLPIKTVNDIWALMYLGRNGAFDGIQSVPVHKRLALYRKKPCFRDDKYSMVRHMVGKSKLLDEYLEDGLRYIRKQKKE